MKSVYIFAPFFLILFPIIIYSQSKNFSRDLHWQPSRSYHLYLDENNIVSGEYLYFKDARYFNNQTLLPYYYEHLALPGVQNYRVKLTNKRFVKLTAEEERLLNDKAQKVLKDEIQLNSATHMERNKPFLQIQFVPLRKNSVTGNIEKLTHFEISYSEPTLKRKSPIFSAGRDEGAPSVMASGKWVKIRLKKDGIYKIGFSRLEKLGFHEPGNVSVYGNSCGLLNVCNDSTKDYRLRQIPVEYEKGIDNKFNKNDYMLFYARGPHIWQYNREEDFFFKKNHLYSDYACYYLTDNTTRVNVLTQLKEPSGEAVEQVEQFVDYQHHEKRLRNLIESGQEWVGEYFDFTLQRELQFDFPHIVEGIPVKVSGNFVSRSSFSSIFSVLYEDENVFSTDIPAVRYDYTGYYARTRSGAGTFLPGSDNLSLQVAYEKGTPSAEGWLNYLTVNAVRELTMVGNQMHFRYKSPDNAKIVEIRLTEATENTEIWEVTNQGNILKVNDLNRSGNSVSFKIRADTVYRSFIAFNHQEYYSPERYESVDNQNLHGMGAHDMLIITKAQFAGEAQSLADLHRKHDGLDIAVVTDNQIYNEYSSGKPDPSAIRNFVRMIYNRSSLEDSLKYLLLFGDGSYDNKNSGESPFLMTYQSKESFNYSRSFVSDDFFGLLDTDENIEGSISGLIDIGIGRFPVNSKKEARNAIDKVKKYLETLHWGPWLNKICFVADDQDNNLHMRDADRLAEFVAKHYPRFNIDKIYCDAYQQKNTATGSIYPGVNEAINAHINNGILLFNYTGHGGERQLAHERILTLSDIEQWNNPNKLPLFMTATCEFTRFDDPDLVSAGEEVFLKPNGGSVALFTTTRLVYASLNYDLNRSFYNHVFSRDHNGKALRFGDIVRLTKNNTGPGNNKRNFSLFGDPALKVPLGDLSVHTDSIIVSDTLRSDTIRALDRVTIHGKITDRQGRHYKDYNGSINLTLLDKYQTRHTLRNDGGNAFTYRLRDNLLFRGECHVQNGLFSTQGIIPKAVLPDTGKGKIIYFGQKDELLAKGVHQDLYVGGYTQRDLNDAVGPEIDVYLNDEHFVPGGITDENPLLYAKLRDSSGINIAGAAIGQNLSLILDQQHQNQYNLNKYYRTEKDNYRKGEIRYQLSGLDKGKHELMLKAWDINDNPSTARINFTVTESEDLKLKKVLNYPNPFTENTAFYFEHNQPGITLDVFIQIFTVSGRVVKTIRRSVQTDGFRAGPIYWDGKDHFGDKIGKGVYLYKIKIRSNDGKFAEKFQKLVILK